MFQCAWCKKDGNVFHWTEDREPLCSEECTNKYHFGRANNMFSGKVSDLSAEQRRAVSRERHHLMQFRGAMRSVDRHELKGWHKGIFRTISTLLYLSLFITIGHYYWWVGFFARTPLSPLRDFIPVVVFYALLFTAFAIQARIRWMLRFHQLYRESEYTTNFFRI